MFKGCRYWKFTCPKSLPKPTELRTSGVAALTEIEKAMIQIRKLAIETEQRKQEQERKRKAKIREKEKFYFDMITLFSSRI